MLLKLKAYSSNILSSPITKRDKKKKRKKHVENMFITNKKKKYIYYHKSSITKLKSKQISSKTTPIRGSYFIKCVKPTFIKIKPLKSIARLMKMYSRHFNIEDSVAYSFKIYPDFSLTSKPKDVRMGKGKGKNINYVNFLKKNQTIFCLFSYDIHKNHKICLYILKQLIYRLPSNFIISTNFW